MSAKLDYVMDELLDARKLWDSPRFLQFAIEDTVPEEGATEADVENAIRILATERRILGSPDIFFTGSSWRRWRRLSLSLCSRPTSSRPRATSGCPRPSRFRQ